MSLSKSDMGLLRHAMALKVKYRKWQPDGSWKVRVAWDLCAPHPDNRGKTFPNGARVKDLAVDVFIMGCVMEEVDHMGLVVEEGPQSRRLDEYSRHEAKGNPDLEACFPTGLPVLFAFLTHTHIGLVVKAFRGKAPWHLPPLKLADGSELPLCDEHGCLTLKYLEHHENGKEFAELSLLGALVEVLNHAIEIEEPNACNIISRALNLKQEVALEQTELQAWEALTMEITLQANASQGAKISFESVKNKVAVELNAMSEDPDLIEMFDLIISLGGPNLSYLQEIRDWGSRFVNQKKRRMRLAGFKVLNSMPLKYPRAKVAVFKLAYKARPTLGYVNSPDMWWTRVTHNLMDKLEAALHYFHITCKASVEALPSEFHRSQFLGSVDVSMAQAFRSLPKEADQDDACQRALAAVAATFRKELLTKLGDEAGALNGAWKHTPIEAAMWLKEKCIPPLASEPTPKPSASSAPEAFARLIEFDEEAGTLLNDQLVVMADKTKAEPTIISDVPWQGWMQTELARSRGKADRARAHAFATMQLAFQHDCSSSHDVRLEWIQGGERSLGCFTPRASKDLEKGELALVPYVSSIDYVSADTKHLLDPDRYTVKVTLHTGLTEVIETTEPTEGAPVGKKKLLRSNAKEDLQAMLHKNAAAVAAPSSKAAKTDDAEYLWLLKDCRMPTWVAKPTAQEPQAGEWNFSAKSNLHPYWTIPRKTQKQATKDGQSVNCHVTSRSFTSIQLGGLYGTSLSSTFEVDLPEITNSVFVAKGEPLVLLKTVQEKEVKPQEYKSLARKHTTALAAKETKDKLLAKAASSKKAANKVADGMEVL